MTERGVRLNNPCGFVPDLGPDQAPDLRPHPLTETNQLKKNDEKILMHSKVMRICRFLARTLRERF